MSNGLHILIANERIADMRRTAERSRAANAGGAARTPRLEAITLRGARPEDTPALDALAQLDSALPLIGETIVAIVGGRIVAALSTEDGRVIASPFTRTAKAVALLRMWSSQGRERPERRRVRLRPRVA